MPLHDMALPAKLSLLQSNLDRFKADEDDDNESYHPSDDDDDYSNGDENHAVKNPIHAESDEVAGVNKNNIVDGNDIINQNENESQTESQTENGDENIVINQNEDQIEDEEDDLADMVDVEVQTENEDNATDDNNIQTQMDKRYGRRSSQYNLRAWKPQDYGHLYCTHLESIAMKKHSITKGLKLFGDAGGVDAIMKELQQLHDCDVLEPRTAAQLYPEQRKDALQYLMFLKQKRNRTIKGRGCADGRKQRATTTKEEASSPTVAIESVMLSCVIDAKEGRDEATVDIPGAFMQADMEDTVHMKLEGKMAEFWSELTQKCTGSTSRLRKGEQSYTWSSKRHCMAH